MNIEVVQIPTKPNVSFQSIEKALNREDFFYIEFSLEPEYLASVTFMGTHIENLFQMNIKIQQMKETSHKFHQNTEFFVLKEDALNLLLGEHFLVYPDGKRFAFKLIEE